MSKPWFLDFAADEASEGLRNQIRGVLGRDLNDSRSVVKHAEEEGARLQNGEGLKNGMNGMSVKESAGEETLLGSLRNPVGLAI